MKDVLTYKEFIGSVHFSADDEVFFGKIEGVNDLVTFEGKSVKELTGAFHKAVDDYMELCKKTGKNPAKSYKGSFNIRISPQIHRKAAEEAAQNGLTLNGFLQKIIENKLMERKRAA